MLWFNCIPGSNFISFVLGMLNYDSFETKENKIMKDKITKDKIETKQSHK